jgi:hypothetical protein
MCLNSVRARRSGLRYPLGRRAGLDDVGMPFWNIGMDTEYRDSLSVGFFSPKDKYRAYTAGLAMAPLKKLQG